MAKTKEKAEPMLLCPACKGKKSLRGAAFMNKGMVDHEYIDCVVCDGTGMIDQDKINEIYYKFARAMVKLMDLEKAHENIAKIIAKKI